MRIEDGTINIVQAVVDGLHAGNIAINGGMLNINANGDGIDGDTGCIDILDGEIIINTPSAASSSIKCDSTLSIYGGTMQLTVSGDQSKGFNSNQNIIFDGGTIDITASGTTVLVPFGSGFDPSYCTAIKCDGNCTINEAFITIVNTASNKGGKGISADGDIIVNGGNLDITTNGGGEIYSNISGVVDAYTSACLKSKSNISLLGGTILCSSTGIGGKGIGADLNMVIGNEGADNDLLHLTVATSGERFLVSGTDYANPKAVKSEGMMTINSGTITVTCTQNNDGGKAVESETAMVINGGNLEIIAFDDGLKTTSDLTINGGTIFCQSNGGDGIDCDGALTINGGTAIVRGADGGKGSFDCPENQFTITGGLLIGTAGSTGIPTENLCTQRSIIYTGTAGDAVSVTNADGNQILVFQMPDYSESSEPEMVLFFSSDEIAAGNGYTFHYGGTITGGTEFHGLYTNADYSGSNAIAFNVNSMVTFVEEVKQATLWMMFHDGTTQTILIDDSGKIYFEESVMKIEDGLGNLFSFDCNIIRKLNFQPGTAEITDMASFKNHIISKTSKNL